MNEVLMAAVVFFAIYQVLKNFTDFFLKRMIIKTGHIDNAGILEQKVSSSGSENQEANKYPSLKWGLVALFAGIGFIIINQINPGFVSMNGDVSMPDVSMLSFGIELVSISMGFITYFLIVNFAKKK